MDVTVGEQAARRYYALVDANDVEGVVSLFTADATYRRPGYEPMVGRRNTGAAAVETSRT